MTEPVRRAAVRAQFSGGIHALGFGTMGVYNCTFENNTAEHCGAVYVQACAMEMHNCVFRNNTAVKHGGALGSQDNRGPTLLRKCDFTENVAGKKGGAVAAWGLMDMDTCTFSMNQAEEGGADDKLLCFLCKKNYKTRNQIFCALHTSSRLCIYIPYLYTGI